MSLGVSVRLVSVAARRELRLGLRELVRVLVSASDTVDCDFLNEAERDGGRETEEGKDTGGTPLQFTECGCEYSFSLPLTSLSVELLRSNEIEEKSYRS